MRHTSTGFRYEDTVNFLTYTYSGTFLRQNPSSLNEKHNASPGYFFFLSGSFVLFFQGLKQFTSECFTV